MDNTYRLTFPYRGWCKISWGTHVLADGVKTQLDRLAELPGVKLELSEIAVPHTAFGSPLFDLLSALGLLDAFEKHALRAANVGLNGERINVYAEERGLYPWQSETLNRLMYLSQMGFPNTRPHLLLCDDMGLGKTRTAIALAELHRASIPRANPRAVSGARGLPPNLIIAPNFTRDVWRRELLAMGAIEHDEQFVSLHTRDAKKDDLDPEARWFFVHYEIVKAWSHRLAMLPPLVAIMDEIHWAKNGRSQRFAGCAVATGRAELRIGLTGTPMANRVDELWAPLTLVCGPGTWGHPIEFRQRYCGATRGEFGHVDGKPTHVEELRARMGSYYERRDKAIVADRLPVLTRQQLTVSMNERHVTAHAAAFESGSVEDAVKALVEGRAGPNAFKLLDKLRKVTSASKLPSTIAHVNSLREQGESVVVFTWQRKTAEAIAKGVSYGPEPYCVTGESSQMVRDAAVWEFQEYGGVLVATYGVLREGVTLTRAAHVLLHDLDYVLSTMLQAEARIHRLGQERGCVASWMIAENSIDTVLAKLLLTKAAHIEKTLGITAPQEAVDAVQLADLVEDFSPAGWARAQLEKWVPR